LGEISEICEVNMNRDSVLDALKKAIVAEYEGHNFYRMSADNTADDRGREVFLALAQEELDHAKYLKTQYNSILENGSATNEVLPDHRIEISGSSPIFSAKLKERIREAHYEMTSLSVGIQLELSAMEFYRTQAERAGDAQVSQFFTRLSEWEKGHYQALLRQQENLKEDYWADNDFSPY